MSEEPQPPQTEDVRPAHSCYARASSAIQMPSLPFTLVSHARPTSLLAIEAVLTVATRAAAVVKPASVAAELAAAACAAVAVHGVAAIAASAADDVVPPAGFSHH